MQASMCFGNQVNSHWCLGVISYRDEDNLQFGNQSDLQPPMADGRPPLLRMGNATEVGFLKRLAHSFFVGVLYVVVIVVAAVVVFLTHAFVCHKVQIVPLSLICVVPIARLFIDICTHKYVLLMCGSLAIFRCMFQRPQLYTDDKVVFSFYQGPKRIAPLFSLSARDSFVRFCSERGRTNVTTLPADRAGTTVHRLLA